jgi:DNA replication protein DnaC
MTEPTRATNLFRLPDPALIAEREAETRAELAEAEASQLREARMKRLRDARPALDYRDVDRIVADDMQTTVALVAVRAFVESRKPLLVLAGGIGVGKTVAAAWWLANRGGEYVRAGRVAAVFRAQFGDEVKEQGRLREMRHLVIDEVGTEPDAKVMGACLFELLDDRRWHEQQTILISNLNRADLLQRYDDPRLHSRMHQAGVLCETGGPDLRRVAP